MTQMPRNDPLNLKLKPPETFAEIDTFGKGISELARISQETMLFVREMPSLPPKLVMDIYRIACIARSLDNTVEATKRLEEE